MYKNKVLNNIKLTYKLIKFLINIKEEIIEWARLVRENRLTNAHQKLIMNKALEIDELLRDVGVEWIYDYEKNQKIKANIGR